MNYRVWYSTESFADYIIANTSLKDKTFIKKKIFESDANNAKNFHSMPDHIKQILYLDAPDLIVELNNEPIFTIEESKEAPTGHNPFQRFARLVASVEHNVPAFYIFTEGKIITRKNSPPKWDVLNNPLIFKALEKVMSIHEIPALFYYFPSDFREYQSNPNDSPNIKNKGLKYDKNFISSPDSTNTEMQLMFQAINEVISMFEKVDSITKIDYFGKGKEKLSDNKVLIERKDFMRQEYERKKDEINKAEIKMSPLTATKKLPTNYLLKYLSQYENQNYQVGELLRNRKETIIYQMDTELRGDPYPGVFTGIDYLLCRKGKTFEDRDYNLVLCVGKLQIDEHNQTLNLVNTGETKESTILDFFNDVKKSEERNILSKNYADIPSAEIPRYYMQVRYGSTFSKVKHIRVFSYFADAILFPDGALWRDA